jgi:ribose-phosphate pyrophosphokinase
MSNYTLVTGSAHPKFAQDVANILKINLCPVNLTSFSDGEINLQITQSVRGKHVMILQPTGSPANQNIMELLLMVDALKRSSAKSITAIIPYFGYARQDRKAAPRVPISAKLIADLLEKAGVSRIVTMDLHAAQIQGFFNIPVDNIYGSIIFSDYLKKQNFNKEKTIIASPDIGGVARARAFAKSIGLDIVIIDKRRERANISEVMNIIGNPEGKDVILIDDIIDTAGTIIKASDALKQKGALSVKAYCTHPVLSGKAYENIQNSTLDTIVTTDTLPIKQDAPQDKIVQITATNLFATVIDRINNNKSVDSLFN